MLSFFCEVSFKLCKRFYDHSAWLSLFFFSFYLSPLSVAFVPDNIEKQSCVLFCMHVVWFFLTFRFY